MAWWRGSKGLYCGSPSASCSSRISPWPHDPCLSSAPWRLGSAQDASAACHVGFEGCSQQRGIRCAWGSGVGLRLPPQQRALGPKSGPMQRYARAGTPGTWDAGVGSAAGEVTSYLVQVRRRIPSFTNERQFCKCSHVYSPHNDKTRNTSGAHSHLTSWSQNRAWWRSIGPVLSPRRVWRVVSRRP